jgi:hypothetical protein
VRGPNQICDFFFQSVPGVLRPDRPAFGLGFLSGFFGGLFLGLTINLGHTSHKAVLERGDKITTVFFFSLFPFLID